MEIRFLGKPQVSQGPGALYKSFTEKEHTTSLAKKAVKSSCKVSAANPVISTVCVLPVIGKVLPETSKLPDRGGLR